MSDPVYLPSDNTGFQNLLQERTTMYQFKHLQNLLTQGSNREAAAIVESFQKQMYVEETTKLIIEAATATPVAKT